MSGIFEGPDEFALVAARRRAGAKRASQNRRHLSECFGKTSETSETALESPVSVGQSIVSCFVCVKTSKDPFRAIRFQLKSADVPWLQQPYTNKFQGWTGGTAGVSSSSAARRLTQPQATEYGDRMAPNL